MKTLKTLKTLVEEAKCRKGAADGTTKRGAYWLACQPIKTRRAGGDGIGNSGADITYLLELRHYRSGEVSAVIHNDSWHQNGSHSGGGDSYHQMPAVLDCATVEEVIVALKAGVEGCYGRETCISSNFEESLSAALAALSMPEYATAPDEM